MNKKSLLFIFSCIFLLYGCVDKRKACDNCYQIYDSNRNLYDHGSFGYPYKGMNIDTFYQMVQDSISQGFEFQGYGSGNHEIEGEVWGYVHDTSRHEAGMIIYYDLETGIIDSIRGYIVPSDL